MAAALAKAEDVRRFRCRVGVIGQKPGDDSGRDIYLGAS